MTNFDKYKGKTYGAKAFLLEVGRIEAITRGRMSNENKAFLAEAAAAGVQFSDFKGEVTTTSSGEKRIKNTAPRTGSSNIDNINEEFVRYPGPHGGISDANSVWKILDPNGKEILKADKNGHGGLKTVCAGCRLSVVGCRCSSPSVRVGERVVNLNIVRR